MEYTIDNLIDGLTYAQLLKMQFDLQHGGLYVKKLVESRIKMLENQNRKVCVSCGAEVFADSSSTYTVLFGPSDFRKKATCCGMDCMEQFMGKLKQFEGIKTTLDNKKEREIANNKEH